MFLEAHLLLIPYHYIIQGNCPSGIETVYRDVPVQGTPQGILTKE
jgi:hypothetical protein